MTTLLDFIRESNAIEGIRRDPSFEEVDAHEEFLARPKITIIDLECFVDKVQPGARLRDQAGMNVRVGPHFPIAGGPVVKTLLMEIIAGMARTSPYLIHQKYENLHPFMDGNGRSGRVLWLWMMGGVDIIPLGFLHHWYYQSLQGWRDS